MPNYHLGKIYKIQKKGGNSQIYIGSTTKPYLCNRFSEQKSMYKNHRDIYRSVFDIFNKYTVDGSEIVLLENVNCNSRDELLARERHWIEKLNCTNKQIPGQTPEEYYKKNKNCKKDYYQNNRINKIAYQKEYNLKQKLKKSELKLIESNAK